MKSGQRFAYKETLPHAFFLLSDKCGEEMCTQLLKNTPPLIVLKVAHTLDQIHAAQIAMLSSQLSAACPVHTIRQHEFRDYFSFNGSKYLL